MPVSRKTICVVTGSRAEYGLLYWVMKEIAADPDLQLQVAVTGMHLAPQFGLTFRAIEADGFTIDAKVDMQLSSDTPAGIAKSIGRGVIGFADAFEQLQPDMILVLGDRYEILAAAQVALVMRIPIAHIAGGDTTEGAFDEAIRHSITKMSHLHFVTNEDAARRVRQLGENPDHIFDVGSPGLDFIRQMTPMDRTALEASLDFKLREKNILVTFHPVTLDTESAATQFQALLDALDRLGPDLGIVFTKPNADTDGTAIVALIDDYVAHHSNARAFTSLGQVRYLSLMAQVDVVAGNSSSGLYEAPSFGIPAVNIGDRQRGRLQAASVINCAAAESEIFYALKAALVADFSGVVNPYGDGHTAVRIRDVLKQCGDPKTLLKKHFFEPGGHHA
jgi:UDP-hydrolysing UDP-N-acetyl-D-glucosamine 2-epimerase